MQFHLPSFLRRVRIHGGEFDSSARAMNRVNEKGSLMTYEGAFLAQADLRIVRGSTIERKQMSTKTTFKRVALVAVAALGFGMLSVAPSTAVALQKITLGSVAGVQTTTGTTNVAVTTLVNFNGYCTYQGDNAVYQAIYSGLPATSKAAAPALTVRAYDDDTYGQLASFYQASANGGNSPYSYFIRNGEVKNESGTVTTVGSLFEVKQNCQQSGRYNIYATASFTPDVAGTYSIMIQDPNNSYTQTTWTVVVSNPTVKLTKAFLNTDSSTALTADAGSFVYTAASNVTAKGALTVKQYSTTDTTTAATTAISQEVVVATTKGLVSKTNDFFAGAKSVTTAAAGSTNGLSTYYLFANGEVGSASVTVTVGGVLVSTKAVTFNGVAATLSAALTAGQKTWIAPTGTTTVTVTAKDSAGNASTNTPTITATPASTAIATAVVNGLVVTITGVAAGTTVVTIADAAAVATSTTYTVTVAPAKSAVAPVITFGRTSYTVGELVTMTISSGMADSATANLFTTALLYSAGNIVWSGTAGTGATHAISGGKVTYSFYAPAVQGNLTITGTTGADVDLATAAVVTGTVAIANPGLDAATDAANEAIDAANAATDAALAAAEAADAATTAAQEASDAVAALSETVTKLISDLTELTSALQAQIKSLAATVAKIAKKVKA